MKKIFLFTLIASALGLAGSAMAQAAGPAGGVPQDPAIGKAGKQGREAMAKMNEEILAKLNLTDDQKAKLKAHREEMETKLKELRKGAKGAKGTPPSEELKEKLKTLRKENEQFMKQTLTKDQMREFQKLRREKMKEMRDKLEAGKKPGTTPPLGS